MPQLVPQKGITNVVAVTAGLNHTLFEKSDGSLWVTGNDRYGQLGDNGNDNGNVPIQYYVNLIPVPVVAPGLLCANVRSGPAANHSLCAGFELLQPPTASSFGGGAVGAGTTNALGCSVTGSAPLTYQWWKNGTMLAGATNSGFTIADAQVTETGRVLLRGRDQPKGIAIRTPQLVKVGNPILALHGVTIRTASLATARAAS